jgi:hypothetical protein
MQTRIIRDKIICKIRANLMGWSENQNEEQKNKKAGTVCPGRLYEF